MTPRPKIQYLLEYGALRVFAAAVQALPAQAGIALGRSMGRLAGQVLRGRVALAHDNLRLAFGDGMPSRKRSAVIQKVLELQGEGFIEAIICSHQDIERNVAVEGWENIERALAPGKGAIIIGPHFGIWEMAAYMFGLRLEKAATVYKAMKNPYVNNYLLRMRQKSGMALISSKNGLRQVLQHLKKNYLTIMIFDQNAGRSGLPATFFGATASTYAGPAAFALKTGCPVLPAYIIKHGGFRRHRMVIGAPFPLIATGDMEKDILANTQQYNDYIEELVRRHPEQWFGWLHRRWKLPRAFTRDAGA